MLGKINGCRIVAAAALPDLDMFKSGRHVIMVERPRDYDLPDKWVVAIWIVGETEWHHGNYCTSKERAMDVFCTRWREQLT